MGLLFFLLLSLTLAVLVKLYIKLFLAKYCKSKVCLVGRTVIVTGGNKGIGYEAALNFACRGARVILACRNQQRGLAAMEKIINLTKNKNVVLKILDLSSLKSVRRFAEDIIENEEKVHILVNNAGLMAYGDFFTGDGLQFEWQCNHLGPVLLTLLLLDLLKKSGPSRIINVSSSAAKYLSNLSLETLNTYNDIWRTYSNTKLANIFFTQEMAKKLKNTKVSVFSLHPGIASTDILHHPLYYLMEPIRYMYYLTKEEGAQTTVYCACEQGIEHLSGSHFEQCHVVKPYKKAQNPALAKQIWDESLKLLKYNTNDIF